MTESEERLVAAERECTEAEREMERCKGEHKAAKDHYETCCLHLRQLVREIDADRERPLLPAFDEAEQAAATTIPEAWKSLPIDTLELPESVQGLLIAAGFTTVGELADHMANHGDFWDVDIKVGGQRKPPRFRATIEEGFSEFWATHPEFCKERAEVTIEELGL